MEWVPTYLYFHFNHFIGSTRKIQNSLKIKSYFCSRASKMRYTEQKTLMKLNSELGYWKSTSETLEQVNVCFELPNFCCFSYKYNILRILSEDGSQFFFGNRHLLFQKWKDLLLLETIRQKFSKNVYSLLSQRRNYYSCPCSSYQFMRIMSILC